MLFRIKSNKTCLIYFEYGSRLMGHEENYENQELKDIFVTLSIKLTLKISFNSHI